MSQQKTKFANVILCVDGSRGFDLVTQPYYLTGSFYGHKMKSRIVQGACAYFRAEMVWESDKRRIRKPGGPYATIRIEVRTKVRQLIGYTILTLRCARFYSLTSFIQAKDIVFGWIKLHEIPTELEGTQPQLSVFLAVKDFVPKLSVKAPMKRAKIVNNRAVTCGKTGQRQPIRMEFDENGFLQLGEYDDAMVRFEFKVNLHVAYNLDMLLPNDCHHCQKGFMSMCPALEAFGIPLHLRNIGEAVKYPLVVLNENIVMRLRCTIETLYMYFSLCPEIKVNMYVDNVLKGWTKLDMATFDALLESTDIFRTSVLMHQDALFEGLYRATTSREEMRRAIVSAEVGLKALDWDVDNEITHRPLDSYIGRNNSPVKSDDHDYSLYSR